MKEGFKKEPHNLSDNEPEDGIYAIPSNPNEPRVKVRALSAYCNLVGKKPIELSDEEREHFLIYPEKNEER